ncbi:MAG: rod shape-determining protein MreD [Thermoleophilia bacterium]|nr:rod shape-determining protein MreD [Thermoleophilia bacterium]
MNGKARITSVSLVLVAALVQVSIGYRVDVAGATPNLLMLVVTAIALLTGSVSGAVHGFVAGLALACFGGLAVGPDALIAALIGFAFGRLGETLITDEHPVPPLVAGVLATAAFQLGVPLVTFLVSPTAPSLDGLWTNTILITLLSAVLTLPVYLGVRRALAATWLGDTPTNSEVSA